MVHTMWWREHIINFYNLSLLGKGLSAKFLSIAKFSRIKKLSEFLIIKNKLNSNQELRIKNNQFFAINLNYFPK